MTYLLDANVLIALADPLHVHHERTQNWFQDLDPTDAWATCPLTENAFLRILGNPNFTSVSGDANDIRELLQRICAWPGHQFWNDNLSLREEANFPVLPGVKKLTDLYLLGLAIKHRGALASLDTRIDCNLLDGGSSAFLLVP